MSKLSRQLAIKEIITKGEITNQDELRRELKRRGFSVTQATLSRDLHDLGVNRASTREGSMYVLRSNDLRSDTRILTGREILSIKNNESLIVIVTLPGCANAVAQLIDSQRHKSILGTIAGDDTIVVIPVKVKNIPAIKRYLQKLILEDR